MNREARFSLASKGFLTAAVVVLIMGAERPLSQPVGQEAPQAAERIGMYGLSLAALGAALGVLREG